MYLIKLGLRHQDLEGIHLPSFRQLLMLTQLISYHWKALDLSYRMVYFMLESQDKFLKMSKFRVLADPQTPKP
jgi:hypothetical protein